MDFCLPRPLGRLRKLQQLWFPFDVTMAVSEPVQRANLNDPDFSVDLMTVAERGEKPRPIW
jgi:hypothetical protein